MGGDDQAVKRAELLKIDKKHPSPELRAKKVIDDLKEKYGESLDDWDITCFAAEWLGLMSVAHPYLEPYARRILSLVYTAHYERFGNTL